MPSCPVCSLDAEELTEPSHGKHQHVLRVECTRCGAYRIDAIFAHFLQGLQHEEPGFVDTAGLFPRLYLISGTLRERSLTNVGEPILLTQETADALATIAPTDVNDRIDRLLLNLAECSAYLGSNVRSYLDSTHRSLGYCQNDEEYDVMVSTLANEGLLEMESHDSAYLTPRGWERVRELRRTIVNMDQAFVAMSFDPALDYIYDDAIKLAVEDAGYRPFRLDREEHADLIDDRMIVELSRSRFVVADVTEHNQGAYFEAGYAMGLGRLVIWTCKEGEFVGKAHFDIEHRNHIIWKDIGDLRRRLALRIEAIMGLGSATSGEG